MFARNYLSILIVGIIIYILICSYYTISLSEFYKYVSGYNKLDTWLNLICIDTNSSMEPLFLQNKYSEIFKNIHYTLGHKENLPIYLKLFTDVTGDLFYEYTKQNTLYHLYIQFYDKNISVLIYKLFPVICDLIKGIPTCFGTELLLLKYNSSFSFNFNYFNGLYLVILPIIVNDTNIKYKNKSQKKIKLKNGKVFIVDKINDNFELINSDKTNISCFMFFYIMRTCYDEHATFLYHLIKKISKLTNRFKYNKFIAN